MSASHDSGARFRWADEGVRPYAFSRWFMMIGRLFVRPQP